VAFVNRTDELAKLAAWFDASGPHLGLVWGRRRVGKTSLLREFARGRRSLFHVGASRPIAAQVEQFSHQIHQLPGVSDRQRRRQLRSWDDVIDLLIELAEDEPLLVVLDEFPELLHASAELPSLLRARREDLGANSKLRLILCGSAIRTMESLQELRAPLYGRFDLNLLVHPFRPSEAALMLPRLQPADRALVWGLLGGVPLYLSMWDQDATVETNLLTLIASPGARLLIEGELLVDTEGDSGGLGRRVLYAIGSGKTKHNEIADAIGADPTRTLDRLVQLRMLDRIVPVLDDPRKTRRRTYQIADNFLRFWLGNVDRLRTDIEIGVGRTAVKALIAGLDDLMGAAWEEAVRSHLRRLAVDGTFGPDVVAVGRQWQDNVAELDGVVVAGRDRRVVAVAEAKWAKTINGAKTARDLLTKLNRLGLPTDGVKLIAAARQTVTDVSSDEALLALTAKDVFAL
jgi:uncharacterized protein